MTRNGLGPFLPLPCRFRFAFGLGRGFDAWGALGAWGSQSGTEAVGAAIAEHGFRCQIGGQTARGCANRRCGAEADQTRAEQDDHFGRAARS